MAYESRWLVENRVLLQRLAGVITGDELMQARRSADELIDSVSEGLVYIIVDERAVTQYPTDLMAVVKVMAGKNSERLAWTLTLSHDKMARFMSSTVSQIIGLRVRAFANVAALVAFLVDQDETLVPFDLPALIDTPEAR